MHVNNDYTLIESMLIVNIKCLSKQNEIQEFRTTPQVHVKRKKDADPRGWKITFLVYVFWLVCFFHKPILVF